MTDVELEVARLLEAGDLKAIADMIEAIPGAVVGPLPVSGHKLILWRQARLHKVPKLTLKLRTQILLALNRPGPQTPVKVVRSSKGFVRRLRLFDQQRGLCHYCQQPTPFGKWTIDHLTPKSRGGGNDWANLKGCCDRCNGDKGSMTEAEFRTLRGFC